MTLRKLFGPARLAFIVFLLAAFNVNADVISTDLPDGSQTEAIRGKTIQVTQAEIDLLYDAQPETGKLDFGMQTATRVKVREVLIQRALMERGALEAALDEDEHVQLQLAAARQLVLANAYEKYLSNPQSVTVEELDTEYDKVITQLAGVEYEIRRLSFVDEVQANVALQALNNNESYESVSEKYTSFTPVLSPTDWRWIPSKRMPLAIRLEVERLFEESAASAVPVKSENSWYLIYVRSKRDMVLPEKVDIEQKMREKIALEKVKSWIDKRRVLEGL